MDIIQVENFKINGCNDNVPTEHIPKRKWAIPDDESDNWSKDVVEFFHADDYAFCNSAHIEGWVGRLMKWRNMEVQSNPSLKLRWTILPPSFVYLLLDSCNKNSVKFANGKFTPFPSIFDIGFIYFPYCFQRQNWSILKVDLKTQELFLFDNKCTTGEEYRTHFHPALRKIAVYFTALLVTIHYWKETRRLEASITFGMNDEIINSSNALNDNEGVFVCMLMEHLVTGKPLNLTADYNSYCISYRQFMVEQLYFWRCLPRKINEK
ncbi:hypothetical protein R6Q57_009798 [Mikania cordata]